MRMQASTPPAAAPPNGAGMSPLRNPAATAFSNAGRASRARLKRVGLLADLGGERTQVLFRELAGAELQLLLLRAEMKRDGHGGSLKSVVVWVSAPDAVGPPEPLMRRANSVLNRTFPSSEALYAPK